MPESPALDAHVLLALGPPLTSPLPCLAALVDASAHGFVCVCAGEETLQLVVVTGAKATAKALLPIHYRTKAFRSVRTAPSRNWLGIVLGTGNVQIHKLISTSNRHSAPPQARQNTLAFEISHEPKQLKKHSHAILGIEWSVFEKEDEFFVVSNDGVDFYSMSKSKRSFILRKSIPLKISFYLYSSRHSLLVVYGNEANPRLVSLLHVSGRRGDVVELNAIHLNIATGSTANGILRSTITGLGNSISRLWSGGISDSHSAGLISKSDVCLVQV
ncbi:hypothetical protein HDU98_006776 [Podochytrium sp. JEL0797]|nr:hypothetical protein HDU98_006776 [Podochytrium sp. JEL0797]